MMVTKAGLTARLEDGRWHQVSKGAVSWFLEDPKYICQMKPFTSREWHTITIDSAPIHRARCLYRVCKKVEFLTQLFKGELT